MKTRLSILSAILFVSTATFAQADFKPSGTAFSNIFMNYNSDLTDGSFDVQRAYLGYKYKFSPEFSTKVTYDVGMSGDGGVYEFSGYLKNAYLAYNKDALSLQFGMFGSNTFGVQQKAWAHRYLYKAFMDASKMASSTDIGFMAAYKINDMFSLDASVLNGKGFKVRDTDNKYKATAGLTAKPVDALTLRAYFDIMDNQQTLAFFAGYKTKALSLGAQYAMQQNHKMIDRLDISGLSVFGMYNATKKVQIFGRFDTLNSTGETYIAGVQYSPIKGVQIAPNVQAFQSNSSLLGTEVNKFTTNYLLSMNIKF